MTAKTRVNGESSAPSLDELLSFAQESGLAEVIWEKGDRRIAFKRAAAPPPPPVPVETAPAPEAPAKPKTHVVKSPMVGTFQRAAKDRPPLVVEGGSVAPGARLAIVEAMQVPKDVIATISGRIVKILVESGRPVEYGQPLFEIEPTEG
jgi:acetyl-CoA carboxylase biotin carboxyl carrier protein